MSRYLHLYQLTLSCLGFLWKFCSVGSCLLLMVRWNKASFSGLAGRRTWQPRRICFSFVKPSQELLLGDKQVQKDQGVLTAHLLRLHQKRQPKYLGLDHALAGPTFVSLALSGCERACVHLWAKAV